MADALATSSGERCCNSKGNGFSICLAYWYLPKSASACLFLQSVKNNYFCIGPISVDPVRLQPKDNNTKQNQGSTNHVSHPCSNPATYIYIYIYVYIHTHIHIYTYTIHTYIYTYMYMYVCIYLSLSLYIYIYIYMYSYTHM